MTPASVYAVSYDEQTSTLRLSGELDELVADQLRDDIARHSAGHTRSITLDLTDVTFLPSVAIGIVAGSQGRARSHGCELVLRAAQGSVASRVLTLVAFDHDTSA